MSRSTHRGVIARGHAHNPSVRPILPRGASLDAALEASESRALDPPPDVAEDGIARAERFYERSVEPREPDW